MTHKDCGAEVKYVLVDPDLFGDGTMVELTMPVCVVHGGPLNDSEIITSQPATG